MTYLAEQPPIGATAASRPLTPPYPYFGAALGVVALGVRSNLQEYFATLSARLKNVRVTCGDFGRVLGRSVTEIASTNAVVLDPPYLTNGEIYGRKLGGEQHPAMRAFEWAKENWHKPNLRIVLCGYAGEFEVPRDWRCVDGFGSKGYAGKKNRNRDRERIWLSPACLEVADSLSAKQGRMEW